MRILISILLLLLPTIASPSCGGQDLRPSLSAEQKAEIAARTDSVIFKEGNHWKATKGGRSIHLIATMHIDDPRMDALAARLAPIIRQADTVLVEATEDAQAQLQRDIATNPELAFLTGATLIDLMPAEEWAKLAAAANARGIPGFMAAKFQPWYLSLMLSVSPCTLKEIASGAKGLDHRIIQIAKEARVTTKALEPYTMIFDLFSGYSMKAQLEMLTVGILPDAVSENATVTLAEQFFEEVHIEGMETSRVATRDHVNLPSEEFDALFDQMIELLVDQRNLKWMNPIEQAQGDKIVVAAGALHLGGENGLLNLLQKRGYTLERLPF